jgi:hypothetical protein
MSIGTCSCIDSISLLADVGRHQRDKAGEDHCGMVRIMQSRDRSSRVSKVHENKQRATPEWGLILFMPVILPVSPTVKDSKEH